MALVGRTACLFVDTSGERRWYRQRRYLKGARSALSEPTGSQMGVTSRKRVDWTAPEDHRQPIATAIVSQRSFQLIIKRALTVVRVAKSAARRICGQTEYVPAVSIAVTGKIPVHTAPSFAGPLEARGVTRPDSSAVMYERPGCFPSARSPDIRTHVFRSLAGRARCGSATWACRTEDRVGARRTVGD